MNLITRTLIKLGILKEDLDYHFARGSMVIIFLFFGYQKWFQYEAQGLIPYISHGPLTFWMYPVFGTRGATWFLGASEWLFGALLFWGFWNKKSRNSWRARFMFFIPSHDYDHSILPGRLGGFCWRVSSNDRTRCLPHERSGAFGSFLPFAT